MIVKINGLDRSEQRFDNLSKGVTADIFNELIVESDVKLPQVRDGVLQRRLYG